MSIPLVSSIYSATRSVLGDTATAAGQVYKDDILQSRYQFAFAELYMALKNVQSQSLRREAIYNVPPNTGYLKPATANIANLGALESIEERGSISAWAISGVTPGAAVATITNAASTLSTGQMVAVYGVGGITDDINDQWAVEVVSTTSTKLNGCTATGTYTAATGTLTYSSEEFAFLIPVPRITFVDSAPQNTFANYAYETDVIRFRPCGAVRQLRITYWLSGNAPTATTASVGIDNCLPFLSYRIAGLAAEARGMLDRASIYNNHALGPLYDSQGVVGGILGQMLDAAVQDLQRLPSSQRRSPPYGGTNYERNWGLIT